jgi:hypothetical protein
MALVALLPQPIRVLPPWFWPAVLGALLVTVVVADPVRLTRRSRQLRAVSIALVGLLLAATSASTALLIVALAEGGEITSSAGELLRAGGCVWLANILAFGLLYWELDGGGAARRAQGMPVHPDIAFVQQLNPDLTPPGWRPRFLDYLFTSFTASTAFSPTDAMPMAPWVKAVMLLQSVSSLAILGLVVARAVNVLP